MKNRQIVMVKRIFSSLLMLVLLSLPAVSAPIDMNTEYFAGKVGINKIITSGAPGFKSQLYVNGAAADTISAIIRAPLNQTADLTQWVTSNAAGVQGAVLARVYANGSAMFPTINVNNIVATGSSAPSDTTYLGYDFNNKKVVWKTISVSTPGSVTAGAVTLGTIVIDATPFNMAGGDTVQDGFEKILSASGKLHPTRLDPGIAISTDSDIYSTAGNIYTLTGRIGAGVASPVGKLSVVADTSSINGLTLQPSVSATNAKNIFAILDAANTKKVLAFNPFATTGNNYVFNTNTAITSSNATKIFEVQNAGTPLFSVTSDGGITAGKVRVNAVATSASLTFADNKNLTVNESLTFNATAGAVRTIEFGAGGTVVYPSYFNSTVDAFLKAAPTSATLATLMGSNTTGYATATDKLVFSNNPVFTTSITDPLLIGGSATTSTLTLRATSAAGTAGADMIFQVGNNGATEAMRIANSGNVGIGTAPNTTDKLATTTMSATRLALTPTTAPSITAGASIPSSSSVVNITSSGAVSTGTIAAGTTGQILIIVGDTGCAVTITDNSVVPGGNVNLAAPITITPDSTLTLLYRGSKWVELSRSLN